MGLKDALFGPRRDDPQVRAYVECITAVEPTRKQKKAANRAARELPDWVTDRLDREAGR